MAAIYHRENCPVCKNNKLKTLYSVDFDRSPVWDFLNRYYINNNIDFSFLRGEQFIIEECLSCGLIYQKNILSDEYMSNFYDEWLTLPIETEVKQDNKYYKTISGEIGKISRYFSGNRRYKFLDFGAGWGDWGIMAKAYGAEVYAAELSEGKREYLKKNGIKIIDLNNTSGVKFDFINTEQVFEHIPDPAGTLKMLSDLLDANGVIKISVPNGEIAKKNLQNPDWFSERFGKRSLMPVQPLEHINCFNRDSLNYLAKQNNLKNISLNHTFQLNKELLDVSVKELIIPLYKALFRKYDFILCLYFRK